MGSRAGWVERSETHQPPTIHLSRLPPDVWHAADNTGKKTPAHPLYLLQFLIEAVVLSALGGIIGILIATAASWGLSSLMGVPFEFDPFINLLSLAFFAGIGVLFGYFPARRAARMDPIEALRHE